MYNEEQLERTEVQITLENAKFYKQYADVTSREDLSMSAKIIHSVILSSCSNEGFTKIFNKTLAEKCGTSISTVKKAIVDLKSSNLISISHVDRYRYIRPLPLKSDRAPELKEDPNTTGRFLTEHEHKILKGYITSWGKRVPLKDNPRHKAGDLHKLNEVNKIQTKTIMSLASHIRICTESLVAFYDQHVKELDPSWLQKKGITRERVLNSEVSLIDAISTHINLLRKGETKEDFYTLTTSLDSFFIQTNRSDDNKHVRTSWLLYWVCKPAVIAQREKEKEDKITPRVYLEEAHPFHKYKRYYDSFDKLFGTGDNKELSEGVTLLVHAYTEKFRELYDHTNSGVYDVGKFMSQYFPSFFKEVTAYMDPIPRSFMPGKKTWNNFMDYLIEKQNSGKKYFSKMKQEVMVSNWSENGA